MTSQVYINFIFYIYFKFLTTPSLELERIIRELEGKLRERDERIVYLEEQLRKPVDYSKWEKMVAGRDQRIRYLEEQLRRMEDLERLLKERDIKITEISSRNSKLEQTVRSLEEELNALRVKTLN